jgi:hypothetical protein
MHETTDIRTHAPIHTTNAVTHDPPPPPPPPLVTSAQEVAFTYTDAGNIFKSPSGKSVLSNQIRTGMLLRTSARPNPFNVLEKQYMHKALHLVLQDSDNMTTTLILNRPTSSRATLCSLTKDHVQAFVKKQVGGEGRGG